jgi:serine/threonine-protein kinase HipA
MAYADMARQAGLDVPTTHLVELTVNRRKEAYFAVQRFDRAGDHKIHFLSLAGYAYASHREPCLDYNTGVLAATRKLTKSNIEVGMAYRMMLFNVLAHNKDDHSKNFAYLLDPLKNSWRLAPAYDLTFSQGMANQHTTSINGAGNPTFKDLKKVASERNVKHWNETLDAVRGAVAKWPEFAKRYDLGNTRTKDIAQALQAIDRACSSGA